MLENSQPLLPWNDSATKELEDWSLIVAVNNECVLRQTLLASPVVDSRCQVISKRNYPSIGQAYNAGIAEARHEIMVFVHQDVYLPADWKSSVSRALCQLSVIDPNWGVLGLVGTVKNSREEVEGYCYSTGLQRFVGAPFPLPVEARSLDEIVLITRRSSGLFFDPNLPGFHLYGTDICLQAQKRNMKCYVIPAFCIHNTNGIKYFPMAFWRGYLYVRRKWWNELPIRTCCTTITKWCGRAIDAIARDVAHALLQPRKVGSRWQDTELLQHFVEHERFRLIDSLGAPAKFETPESKWQSSFGPTQRAAHAHLHKSGRLRD